MVYGTWCKSDYFLTSYIHITRKNLRLLLLNLRDPLYIRGPIISCSLNFLVPNMQGEKSVLWQRTHWCHWLLFSYDLNTVMSHWYGCLPSPEKLSIMQVVHSNGSRLKYRIANKHDHNRQFTKPRNDTSYAPTDILNPTLSSKNRNSEVLVALCPYLFFFFAFLNVLQ